MSRYRKYTKRLKSPSRFKRTAKRVNPRNYRQRGGFSL